MEFIVPKEIELTKNLENASVLTPEVNVYVIEESTVNTKELETNIKSKSLKENTLMIWNMTFLHFIERIVFWERSFLPFWQKCFSFQYLWIYLSLNLDVLIKLLVQQSNIYSQQSGSNFLTNAEEIKSLIDVCYNINGNDCQAYQCIRIAIIL